MLKDIFGSLGFVIVGSDILFWAYFFIMDKVSVFESSDFGELRIIVDPKGDVWFVASDVAKSLGYINAKDAVKRHVDDDDSMLLQVSDNQWGVKRSILKTRYIDSIRIINESGLYSLILSSKLESAKRFKKWITSEVLPPQPGQYQAMQTRVVDLTVELTGETKTYTVMDSALHELKDRIDKDPKYKDVKNWLESLPKI